MPTAFDDPADNTFIHELIIPVRYAETDQMGVVHHSVPALWFEDGRTRMMADAGYPYKQVEQDGVFLPVVELKIRYLKPVLYGGRVIVQTWIHSSTRTKVRFRNRVLDEADRSTCIEGLVTIGCLNATTRRPVRFNLRLERFAASGGRLSADES